MEDGEIMQINRKSRSGCVCMCVCVCIGVLVCLCVVCYKNKPKKEILLSEVLAYLLTAVMMMMISKQAETWKAKTTDSI